MAPVKSLITAEQLSENPPHGRCELVRGEVVVMSPAGSEHGWIVMNVSIPIGSFVKEQDLGYVFGAETGFVIHRNPDSVRAPDVAFVRKERVQGGLSPQHFPVRPILPSRCSRRTIPPRKCKKRPKTGYVPAATKCGSLILAESPRPAAS